VLGLIYWIVISRRKQLTSVYPHIDYWVLLLIVGFYFLALQGGIYLRLLLDPNTFQLKDAFLYPEVLLFLTLGALSFILLFLIFGRRSETMMVGLAYAVAVGVFLLDDRLVHAQFAFVGPAVAIGSLLFLMFAPLSRKLRERYGSACLIIADLNLAFIVFEFIAFLLLTSNNEYQLGQGELSLGPALLVLAALVWDMVSSGETITNRHTDTFPRLARVAIFIAYIISIVLLVMVSTAGKVVLSLGEASFRFNPEAAVFVGLILFGAPFIFVMATLRLRNLLAAADAQAVTPERAAPVAL
jgi:hypothetical protein